MPFDVELQIDSNDKQPSWQSGVIERQSAKSLSTTSLNIKTYIKCMVIDSRSCFIRAWSNAGNF